MREDKLFKAVKGVDDDLICEMLEYSPEKDVKGDVSEGVIYTVPEGGRRARGFLRFSVTAAAALAVAVGVLFVINNNGGIPDNMSAATGEETIETVLETDNSEASATADTDTSSEETQPNISEAPVPVVPLKTVCVVDDEFYFRLPTGIYVDSYPEIPQPDFSEEYFTEMSTKELLEYYGFCNTIEYFIDSNQIIEITDENTHHGIYTLPDGSVYDINTFTFELTEKTIYSAHRFTITMGKRSKFGQEYIEYYKSKGILVGTRYSSFYNEERDVLFSVFKMFGGTVMLSATPDEITSNYFDNNSEMRDDYEDYHGTKLPGYFEMFITLTINCMKTSQYFDSDKGLWYDEENDSYFNEDTFEWIPADQWEFD